jgi:hypothetical protein
LSWPGRGGAAAIGAWRVTTIPNVVEREDILSLFLRILFSFCRDVLDSQGSPRDILGTSLGNFPVLVFDSKGAILMTLFALMDCCELLAIDPKTLHHWLEQATMSLSVHPVDKRRKCLTLEQVQQLAVVHDRLLQPEEARRAASLVETPPRDSPQEPAHPYPISNAGLGKTSVSNEEQLRQKLSHLEAQVIAQQQQVILLTRDLLRERATRTERCLSPLDTHAHLQGQSERVGSQHENLTASVHVAPQDVAQPLHPAEQRARFLVLPPLIEYSAAGIYVVISSQEGEIPLIADSLEWFEWFRTLSSFRFVGSSGHFGACRGYDRRPTRTWYAHRTLHQHEYRHYLGLSEHLTIAHLEQMAAKLQSYV